MFIEACKLLNLPTNNVAMVAAHIDDLRAASLHGLKTVYVRRETEDLDGKRESVKIKAEGGEVDVIVDSLLELAQLV
jgi:FMN phosphatase YigB (HAD superfamily)